MRRWLFTCLLVLACLAGAWGAPPTNQEIFTKANQAYQEGRYVRAAELYRQLLDRGVDDAVLWYDLGTTYLQLEDLGQARAALERARLLAPWDRDIATNLGLLRGQLQDPEPAESWLVRLAELIRVDHLALTFAVFNFATGGLVLLALGRRHEVLGIVAGVCLVLTLILGMLLAVRMWVGGEQAAVIPQTVILKNGPGREFTDSIALHAGSQVDMLQTQGDWAEVRALGSVAGWIRLEDLARFGPPLSPLTGKTSPTEP